jgi:hypothetical protein
MTDDIHIALGYIKNNNCEFEYSVIFQSIANP